MLVGRKEEQRQLERLLGKARHGRGGALVLRGEAGVGKTALLEHALDQARGFRVLRALGVEAEAELPFAALHELVRPLLGLLDDLPEPQAAALRAALALAPADGVDRFAAYAATLGLLAAATADRPLLCVVDDAHWLDQQSAEALAFAARRIENEAVAMLFSARDPAEATYTSPGIRELRVAGLAPEDASAFLTAAVPTLTAPDAARIVEAAQGNPLALLEFGAAAAESGRAELEGPLPVGERVERSFRERSSRLSPAARRALLLVAAADPSESEAISAALEGERISDAAIAEAEAAGLLVRGGLAFCHPLARSAIYQAAPPAERRAAHAALASTTEHVERRAWHLGAAATDPDEAVAAALEEVASAAGERGGSSAEARALERAAELSPAPEAQARRFFRAGLAAEAAGRLEHAEELLDRAASLTEDPLLRADAVARRSYLLFDRGELDRALELATVEADRAPPVVAAHMITASGVVHALVHHLDIPAARTTAERAAELAGPAFREDLDLCHMLAWTWELSGRTSEALALARECAGRVDAGTILAVDFAVHFVYLEDYRGARELLDAIVARLRQSAAVGNLSYALEQCTMLELRTGRLTSSYAAGLESVQLAEPLGNDVGLASAMAKLALVETALGRSEDARAHAASALEISESRGDRYNAVRARGAMGLDALTRGEPAAAVDWLEPAAQLTADGGVHHPNLFRIHADLIEAQMRAGRRDHAERSLGRLVEDARSTRSRWAAAAAARCSALVADDAESDAAFAHALQLHGHEPDELERARTALCYGERLRRMRRRRDSREHLHEALEIFERLGARPWADRARAELRASGEHLRRRGPAAQEQLTPQELQVSLGAAEGLTNKEIAARLFLSPKTVEFHLSRAYRKLDVSSRVELARLFASQPGAVERLPA